MNDKPHGQNAAMARSVELGIEVPDTERYSMFTKYERWYIVFLIAFAGWFSTLSSFIYYPAIKLIAKDLDSTISQINLTVTSYMAVSTIAPAFVGDAADLLGRRALYLIVIAIYFAANISLANAHTFPQLLGLRMLQSAGVAGTFSIAYGVVADIATPAERGSYVSALSFGITTAPSIGPLLGGAIAYAGGWQWIFWFLTIASACCLAMMAVSLPETARNIVGNGSKPPPVAVRLPYKDFMNHWARDLSPGRPQLRIPNPLKSLTLLFRKDTFLLVLAGGILYTVYCCIHTSLSTQFIDIYGLNQWQAGLVYLPFGFGAILSTLFSGKLLDDAYKVTALAHGHSTDKARGDDLDTFPIEIARLKCVWIPVSGAIVSVIAYGWALRKGTSMAAPLAMQFLVGLSIQTCFNVNNTLLVDINHRNPSAAQASSNVIRCTLSAIAISFLQDLIDRVGFGWAFTILGGSCCLSVICYVMEWRSGMTWRQKSLPADSKAFAANTLAMDERS